MNYRHVQSTFPSIFYVCALVPVFVSACIFHSSVVSFLAYIVKPLTHKRIIEKELEGFGIRLNSQPANLSFRRKDKGGINFTSTVCIHAYLLLMVSFLTGATGCYYEAG